MNQMVNGSLRVERPTAARIVAATSVPGAVVSVAAGIGYGELPSRSDPEAVLRYLAARPDWYWPTVHLGFVLGAVLWVCAFVALAELMADGPARSLARLGAAAAVLGATVHVVDSSLSGAGLSALAHTWDAASADERAQLLRDAKLLMGVLEGTWASVVTFFHGVPFVLVGTAMLADRRYPDWLGWMGLAGGLGSLVLGPAMFLDVDALPWGPFVVFALVVSLWMVAVGVCLWRRATAATPVPTVTQPAAA